MEHEPEWKRQLDGYIRRHEADTYAHAPFRDHLRIEFMGEGKDLDRRLTVVENWVQRMIGVGMLAGALIGGGIIGLVIELARHP